MRKTPSKRGIIIAIDGPSGAGKSTVSRAIAKSLKGKLVDTGATYRAVAYFGIKSKFKKPSEFVSLARKLKFQIHADGHSLTVNGKKLGKAIRTQEVSQMASNISKIGSLRKILTQKQRELAKNAMADGPVIVEGRDIGTVVFPKVKHKFFITADEQTRANRRFNQLKNFSGKSESLSEILTQNRKRDQQDSKRKAAPLKCAKDATVLDSSHLDISEVVDKVCAEILKKQTL